MKNLLTSGVLLLTLQSLGQTNALSELNRNARALRHTESHVRHAARVTTHAVQETTDAIETTNELVNLVTALRKNKAAVKEEQKKAAQPAEAAKTEPVQPQTGQQKVALSPVASLLFNEVKTKLSDPEKNQIAKLSGATLAADKQSFLIEGENADITIYPMDLNNDGMEDIFINTGSTFMYGNTGVGFSFLMKDKAGNYKSVLNMPGIPSLIYTTGKPMPAVEVGGPGFVFPVFDWNGSAYVEVKNYNTKNKKMIDATEQSEKYTAGIK